MGFATPVRSAICVLPVNLRGGLPFSSKHGGGSVGLPPTVNRAPLGVPERVASGGAALATCRWATAGNGELQSGPPTSRFDPLGVPRLAGREPLDADPQVRYVGGEARYEPVLPNPDSLLAPRAARRYFFGGPPGPPGPALMAATFSVIWTSSPSITPP